MFNKDDVEIYETSSDENSDRDVILEEEANPDIYTGTVSHEAALDQSVTRTGETLDERVARIRREIEEIRNEAPPDLLSELRNASHQPAKSAKSSSDEFKESVTDGKDAVERSMEASNEFAKSEDRIAKIETRLGASFRNQTLQVPVADTIKSIQTTLDLLSSDPTSARDRVKGIVCLMKSLMTEKSEQGTDEFDATKAKVDWIYAKLRALDQQVSLVPHTVSRLQTLRFFHSETLQATEQIKTIESSLEQMKREIKEWTELLHKFEENKQ